MLVGMEQAFPRPDNPAKLNRSIDSARSTGLYPPNAPGLVDHQNRNRSGMYDNGNPRDRFAMIAHIDPTMQARVEDGWACRNNFELRVPFAHIPRDELEEEFKDSFSSSSFHYTPSRGARNGFEDDFMTSPGEPKKGFKDGFRTSPGELERVRGRFQFAILPLWLH